MKKIEVSAAAIQKGNKILITKRNGGEFDGMWEFPGGKIKTNETREAAVIREIKEELKVDIDPTQFLTTIEYEYPNFHLTMHVFICRLIKGNITLTEHSDYMWVTKDTLKDIYWIPADIDIIPELSDYLNNYSSNK